MDETRRWTIEMFGADGMTVRQRVIDKVNEEHFASVEAQEVSGHRSRGVYGQFWRGILERFELAFKDLGGVSQVRPGRAPYTIPVINGTAIFPWRYGDSRDEDISKKNFATSDARLDLFEISSAYIQTELDLGISHQDLTSEEEDYVKGIESMLLEEREGVARVVVVAIASSPLALFDVQWGEVTVGKSGMLVWHSQENLLSSDMSGTITLVSEAHDFVSGDVPEMNIQIMSEANKANGEVLGAEGE